MRIIKMCGVCGKEFVASKMTSKYCSRRCERVAFRKRESEKKKNEKESAEALREEEKIKSLREKAFLTPKDVGVLFGVSRATVVGLIIFCIVISGALRILKLSK